MTKPNTPAQKLTQLRAGFAAKLGARLSAIHELAQALNSSGWPQAGIAELYGLLHQLSGSAGTFGFPTLGQQARALELDLRAHLDSGLLPEPVAQAAIFKHIDTIEQLGREVASGQLDADAGIKPRTPNLNPPQDAPLICILEDDTELAAALEKSLSVAGYAVRLFGRAADFRYEAFLREPVRPAMLIIDLILPEGQDAGLEIMRGIAAQQDPPPMLAISVRDDLPARIAAYRAGAIRYLKKPLDLERMVRILDGITRRASISPYRVLLVDDDQALLEYSQAVLSAAGMEVRAISDPLQTLDAARELQPDVFVLDVYMPSVTGTELAAALREEDAWAQTPILFLSGEQDPARQIEALRAGGDEFLTKPIAPEILVAAVEVRAQRSRHLQRLMTELGASETHFHTIVDTVVDSIITIDVHGNIRSVNPATATIFGYPPNEIQGRNVSMLMPAPYQDEHDGYMEDYLATGQARIIGQGREVEGRHKDGSTFPMELAVNEMQLDGERMFVGVLHNISERKQAEQTLRESENKYRTLSENVPGMIYHGKPDWSTEFIISSESLCGYTSEELQGKDLNWPAIIHPDDRQPVREETARLEKEPRSIVQEYRIVHKDGDIRWVSDHKKSTFDTAGRFAGVDGIVFDITERKQAQARIQQLGERLRLATESTGVGIWDWDLQHHAARWDRAQYQLYGLEVPAEPENAPVIYEAWQQALHPDDLEQAIEATEQALSGERPYNAEFRVIWPNGDVYWLNSRATVHRDAAGKPLRMIGTTIDITERKVAEAGLKDASLRLSLALESAQLGIWDWDVQHNNLVWDARMYELYGVDPAAFEGVYEVWQQRLHPDDLVRVEAALQSSLSSGENFEPEFRIVLPDGEVRYIKASGQVVWNGGSKPVRMVGINFDITERKQVEIDLQTARETAEEANRGKSLFLANMSHELRTPMNAILGFAQLLELKTEAVARDYVQEILGAGNHLLKLINEILDLEKIESGHVDLSIEPVNAGEIVGECLQLVEPLAQQRQIRLLQGKQACEDLMLLADRTRLRQALMNYLSNAFKYNREGGEVRVDTLPAGEGSCRLQVRDTGPGLTDTQRAILFQPFTRLAEHINEVEGTGIGLVITQRLVEMMGGKVGVESERGVGSTFWLELPAEADQRQASHTGMPRNLKYNSATQHRSATVLCIEDNPANLRLIEHILADMEELRLVSAQTAVLGLDMALADPPDVILMDISLPGMNGYEALKKCQADPRLASIPVIAITAMAMQSDIRKGLEAGFYAYLIKPLQVEMLRRVVREALALR